MGAEVGVPATVGSGAYNTPVSGASPEVPPPAPAPVPLAAAGTTSPPDFAARAGVGSTTPHEGACGPSGCYENDSSASGRSPSGFGDSGSGDSGSGDSGSSGSAMMLWQWTILLCCLGGCIVAGCVGAGGWLGWKDVQKTKKSRAAALKKTQPEITPTPAPEPVQEGYVEVREVQTSAMTEPLISEPVTVQMPLPTVAAPITQYTTVAPAAVAYPTTTSAYYSAAGGGYTAAPVYVDSFQGVTPTFSQMAGAAYPTAAVGTQYPVAAVGTQYPGMVSMAYPGAVTMT